MNAFVTNLKAQLEADPDRSRRGDRILRIINSRPSKMRDRRLARMEAHARAAVAASPNEAVDWSKVDWAGVFEKILEILLKFLPLII